MSTVKEVSDGSFETDVLKSDKLAIVDFWTPWCMPCRTMSPILEDVAGKNDTIKFFKLNTDDNRKIPSQFKIRGIPSLIFFKDGQEVNRLIGVQSADVLQSQLDRFK